MARKPISLAKLTRLQTASANAGVPNRIDLVRTAAEKWPAEFLAAGQKGHPQQHAFVQRLAAYMEQQTRGTHEGGRWGLNGKRGNVDDFSDDSIAYRGAGIAVDRAHDNEPMEIIDVIARSGTPDAAPAWQPGLGGPGDVGAWVAPDLSVIGEEPLTVTRLGFGWFSVMAGLKFWPNDVIRNHAWLRQHLAPDYFRIMTIVEGRDHGDPDPWRDAGSFLDWPDWRSRYREAVLLFASGNAKTLPTIFGGRNQTPTMGDKLRAIDRFVEATDGLWDHIELVEVVNEFRVNNFTAEEVRELGRHLRSQLPPGFPMALSSPHLAHNHTDRGKVPTEREMRASFDELYGGDAGGANRITIHVSRDPESRWSDPANFNAFLPNLPKVSGEPRGPGASAGGDVSDPDAIAADYKAARQAGWAGYTAHTAWSVFNGRLPHEYKQGGRYSEMNVWDHSNMEAIAHRLRGLRRGEVDGPTEPPAPRTEHLDADQALRPDQALTSPNGEYSLLYQLDGNLVLYRRDQGAIWASHTDGQSAGRVLMQLDGNLVIYDAADRPLWASGTEGHDGAMVQLQDDGNLVIYHRGAPLWDSASDH